MPCSVLAVMFCPGCPVLSWLSCSVLAVLFCPGCHVLSWLSCPVQAVLSWLPGCACVAVLSWLSCTDCPVLAVLSWFPCWLSWSGCSVYLYCSGCPVTQFLLLLHSFHCLFLLCIPFFLSCSACHVLPVLFRLSCSDCLGFPHGIPCLPEFCESNRQISNERNIYLKKKNYVFRGRGKNLFRWYPSLISGAQSLSSVEA